MRLYLVRHAQSVNNALAQVGKYKDRVEDPPLTEIGEKQAVEVGKWIANNVDAPLGTAHPFEVTHIYCSAMTRAMQTAQAISDYVGIEPEVWLDAHEIGGIFLEEDDGTPYGLGGITRTEAERKFPTITLPNTLTNNGWWDINKGRETQTEAMFRAIKVLDLLKPRMHSHERIVVVSHGGFMDMLIKGILNQLPTDPSHLFYLHYNTAITRFDFYPDSFRGEDQMRLHYLNRVDHLPDNMRTW